MAHIVRDIDKPSSKSDSKPCRKESFEAITITEKHYVIIDGVVISVKTSHGSRLPTIARVEYPSDKVTRRLLHNLSQKYEDDVHQVRKEAC